MHLRLFMRLLGVAFWLGNGVVSFGEETEIRIEIAYSVRASAESVPLQREQTLTAHRKTGRKVSREATEERLVNTGGMTGALNAVAVQEEGFTRTSETRVVDGSRMTVFVRKISREVDEEETYEIGKIRFRCTLTPNPTCSAQGRVRCAASASNIEAQVRWTGDVTDGVKQLKQGLARTEFEAEVQRVIQELGKPTALTDTEMGVLFAGEGGQASKDLAYVFFGEARTLPIALRSAKKRIIRGALGP